MENESSPSDFSSDNKQKSKGFKLIEEKSGRIPKELYENIKQIEGRRFQYDYLNPQQTRFKTKGNTWDQFLGMLISSRKVLLLFFKSWGGLSQSDREEDLIHKK